MLGDDYRSRPVSGLHAFCTAGFPLFLILPEGLFTRHGTSSVGIFPRNRNFRFHALTLGMAGRGITALFGLSLLIGTVGVFDLRMLGLAPALRIVTFIGWFLLAFRLRTQRGDRHNVPQQRTRSVSL